MSVIMISSGKRVPILLKGPSVAKNLFVAFGVISKPMSYAVIQTGQRHSMVLAPVIQDHNKMLYYKGFETFLPPKMPLLSMAGLRYCTTNSSKPTPSSPNPPTPSPSNFPDKEQVEKYIFRVIAFFWDYGNSILTWSLKMFKTHIIDDPSVQFYWKRFHDKMDEAKKNF